jgi:hypothetical protein
MKPLLEIRSIPISIEYKVTPAQIERKNIKAEVEISRDKKGLSIKSRPIQLSVDSFEARNSIANTAMRSQDESANLGKQAALNYTATIAREGSAMMDIHLRQNVIPQLAAERFKTPQAQFNIKWLPEQPINMNWLPGELNIEYEMDDLDFNWQINQGNFKFIPASIEFTIAERPHVVIEYVGDPIYVPPSANPNYEPAVDILT